MPFPVTIIGFGARSGIYTGETEHYARLIKPYVSLSFVFLKNSAKPEADHAVLREAEGKMLCDRWPKRSYPVALSEEGKLFTSHSFSRWLGERMKNGICVTFNIGSAYGLSPSLKKQCQDIISFSPMTLPHRLCYTVLVEQLYRACTILKGHPYHK